jgi:hypothetical protein
MVLKEKYTSLHRTLEAMQLQIEDSLDYAREFVPRGQSPSSLFWLLKQHTTYRHDPPGVELLQSMPTLWSATIGECLAPGIATALLLRRLRAVLWKGSPAALHLWATAQTARRTSTARLWTAAAGLRLTLWPRIMGKQKIIGILVPSK